MIEQQTTRDGNVSPQLDQSCMFPGFLFELWPGPAANALASSRKFNEGIAIVMTEWQDFVSRRLEEGARHMQALATCNSPDRAWNMMSRFWEKAVHDYWQEFETIARLTAASSLRAMSVTERGVEEASSDTLPSVKAASRTPSAGPSLSDTCHTVKGSM